MFYINESPVSENKNLSIITNIITKHNTWINNHPLYLNKLNSVFLPKTYYNRLSLAEDDLNTVSGKIGLRHSLNLILYELYRYIEKRPYTFDIFSIKKSLQELNKLSEPKILVITNDDWLKLVSTKYVSKNVEPCADSNLIQATGYLGKFNYDGFSLDIITDAFYKSTIKHSFILGNNYAEISHSNIFINNIYEDEVTVQKGLSIKVNPNKIIAMPFIE